MNSTRAKIIEIAIQQLGYKETPAGTNKTKFGAWFGFDGVPWCGVFCSWCYNIISATQLLPTIDFSKGFASVPALYQRAKKENWITLQPVMADLALYDWNGDKAADHVGLFVCWITPGLTFLSIEGNTGEGNDSNGGEVMIRERHIASVLSFVTIPSVPL